MRENRSWMLDGVVVGSTTFLAVGAVWLTQPRNGGGMMAAGAVGAGGATAFVSRQRERTTQALQREMRIRDEQSGGVARRLGTLERDRNLFQTQIQELNQRFKPAALPGEIASTEPNQRFPSLQNQMKNLQDQIKSLQDQVHQLKNQSSPGASSPSLPVPAKPASESSQPTSELVPSTKSKLIKKLQKGEFGSKNPEKVKAWLQKRGVVVTETLAPIDSVAQHYGQLANYMGEHYGSLKGLINAMKRSLHHDDEKKRNQFRFNPTDAHSFGLCHRFCKKLQESFLVSDYKWNPRTQWLQGTLHADADGLRAFLDGKWFERFTHQKMTQLLTDKGLDHACLLNPKVTFPGNSNHNELDTLFLVEGTPIGVECKSGGYDLEDARNFASHCEKLGIAKQHALFVALDVPDDGIEVQNSRVTSITITNIEQLEAHLEAALNVLEQDIPDPSPGIAAPNPAAQGQVPSGTRGVLGKVKYRPVRDDRPKIIAALTQLFQQPEDPASPRIFVTVKVSLSDLTGISKSRINDVLQVLKHAGYFLDENGEPIGSITQPIAALKSLDPGNAEQAFLDQYALNILNLDLEFFDTVNNRRLYEEVVGGKAPDEMTLERLKDQLFDTTEDDLGESDLV